MEPDHPGRTRPNGHESTQDGKTLTANRCYEMVMRLPGATDAEVRVIMVVAMASVGWGRVDFTMPVSEIARRADKSPDTVQRLVRSIRSKFPGLVTTRMTKTAGNRSWNAWGVDLGVLAELADPPWEAPRKRGVKSDTPKPPRGGKSDTPRGGNIATSSNNRTPKRNNHPPKEQPDTDRAATRRSVAPSPQEGEEGNQDRRVNQLVPRLEGLVDDPPAFAGWLVANWDWLADHELRWYRGTVPRTPVARFLLGRQGGVLSHLLDVHAREHSQAKRDQLIDRDMAGLSREDRMNYYAGVAEEARQRRQRRRRNREW